MKNAAIQCLNFIDEFGVQEEGIFRIPGSQERVAQLYLRFMQNGDTFLPEDTPVACVASLLKQILRELPETLLTDQLFDEFKGETNPEALAALVARLPAENRYLLLRICNTASLICSNSKKTKMDFKNLGICFQPNLLKREDSEAFTNLVPLFESLVKNRSTVFSPKPLAQTPSPNAKELVNQETEEPQDLACTNANSMIMDAQRREIQQLRREIEVLKLDKQRMEQELVEKNKDLQMARVELDHYKDDFDERTRKMSEIAPADEDEMSRIKRKYKSLGRRYQAQKEEIATLKEQLAKTKPMSATSPTPAPHQSDTRLAEYEKTIEMLKEQLAAANKNAMQIVPDQSDQENQPSPSQRIRSSTIDVSDTKSKRVKHLPRSITKVPGRMSSRSRTNSLCIASPHVGGGSAMPPPAGAPRFGVRESRERLVKIEKELAASKAYLERRRREVRSGSTCSPMRT